MSAQHTRLTVYYILRLLPIKSTLLVLGSQALCSKSPRIILILNLTSSGLVVLLGSPASIFRDGLELNVPTSTMLHEDIRGPS